MAKSFIKNYEQIELIIPGYPKGSDITILGTSYFPRTKNDNDEYEKDYINILFRDNKTGQKKMHTVYEPLYTFYKIGDNFPDPTYNLFFIEKEKVEPYTCKYADILKAIAEVTDNKEIYQELKAEGNYSDLKKLHNIPTIFFSNMNIENYYRFLFGLSYTNNTFKLSKGYVDIEVDGRYCLSDFPEPGEVPINAMAYCDEKNGVTYQFLLNDPNNPSLQEYRRSFKRKNIQQELYNFVIDAVGGYKKALKYGVNKMKYKILFFDSEVELIKTFFKVINATEPDFITIWNMAFDLDYIMARLYILGEDPVNVITDPRITPRYLKFFIDQRNKNNYEERGDYVSISSYSIWLDQMIEFASRRKGRGRYSSFKLDYIGEIIAEVRKLDYSHLTRDINMLPYVDYKTFSFYNVMDVIVQKCIEACTQDMEYVFTKCLVNNTIYPKCHRQSVYLANRFAKDFWSYGYVIGNNKNLWNEQPTTKFPGAMVGNPLHNNADILVKINGRPTMLVDNSVDFDYSSLYPSIILENNLAANTQIGRVIIEDVNDPNRKFSLNEHPDMYSNDDEEAKYTRGGEFIANYISNNILEFCRRWMGLGDIYAVQDDIREFFNFNRYSGPGIDFKLNQATYDIGSNLIPAVEFVNNDYDKSQAVIFDNHFDKSKSEEMIKEINKGAIL